MGASSAPAVGPEAPTVASGVAGRHVRVRECWLTVAFLPPPVDALREALQAPLDLSVTFYGPDPLLGVWGLSYDRARTAGERVERPIVPWSAPRWA